MVPNGDVNLIQLEKSREREKADGRRSGSAGDSASLSFSARLARLTACACLRRASARRTCLCQAHATVPDGLIYTERTIV